ncbi:Signal recognition particle receptor subunit alpha SCDLUD_004607 [Saccharomycodes ludwigii]|uniref:Signal recognition particle receptor subunit alpha n=1 Tax=Saccharomycodes ludwigii TaxID=36035 RepID=UPI001E87398D|nr:hypothetical protein SCDLUD_004607 [Saccharomycodes ludwigii]KAH3899178.1 hypothetical protein SCDLUD_004607 [Saccharomycodes ludwigii]
MSQAQQQKIEQFIIFDDYGHVYYTLNEDKKQITLLINSLISDYLIGGNDTNNNSIILSKNYKAKFKTVINKPKIRFVVLYPNSSNQPHVWDQMALDLLQLGERLWESLDLTEKITLYWNSNSNIMDGDNENSNNLDILEEKFRPYFKVKYEEILNKNSKKLLINGNMGPDIKQKANQAYNNNSKQGKSNSNKKNTTGNKSRKWNIDGSLDESGVDANGLDFSQMPDDAEHTSNNATSNKELIQDIDSSEFGGRNANGDFLIKEVDDLLSDTQLTKKTNKNDSSKSTGIFNLLQNKFLGNKKITDEDLSQVTKKFEKNLIAKNVAPEVANYLMSQIKKDLVGSTTANWTSVESTAKESLSKTLTTLLTPGVSIDLLHEIQKKRRLDPSSPYVFSVVGVNGVGKSTNLSKLAFWLLQNNFKVLIVACDTFRSGAVEQLRVHVENLAELTDSTHVRGSKNTRGKSGNDFVELFEAGYGGSDLVTKTAKQAIKYASENKFDIVLMDTAGRRHNDATLMSPLKTFAEQAKPDKIIMVGEALVGTDSVQQAKNFNAAFGKNRNLDFLIISKCDTVGDMLGTMVNMVYATHIPILFIGVGQTYTDIRTLSVSWAVNTLLSY